MCETRKETITKEKVASAAAPENEYCEGSDCCFYEYAPDISEGYKVIETENGIFMFPDISEEDCAAMGFTPMTEEEAEEHRKSLGEYWDSLSDEEIEFLTDSAEAVVASLEEAAACYDQLTEYEKLEIFGVPTFCPAAGEGEDDGDGEKKEATTYERS